MKLGDHKNRAFWVARDVSNAPLKDVVQRLTEAELGSKQNADSEAVSFYLLNHYLGTLKTELGLDGTLSTEDADFMDKYFSWNNEIAVRMFYYVLMICTRECRHIHYLDNHDKKLKELGGQNLVNFMELIHDTGSNNAANYLKTDAPKMDLGRYTEALEYLFFHGNFSGGYGGHKWGEVAKVLRQFVYGEFSAELFVDLSFALCHNNGPIFNKGMYYTGYSSGFIKILDIQRAGQIPMIFKSGFMLEGDHDKCNKIWGHLPAKFKNSIPNYIDWYAVDKDGIKSYMNEKSQQAKNGLAPAEVVATLKKEKDKKDLEVSFGPFKFTKKPRKEVANV